jgi:DNA-3-methyladenine glycosylase
VSSPTPTGPDATDGSVRPTGTRAPKRPRRTSRGCRYAEDPPLPRRLARAELPCEAVALARALIGKSLVHELPDGSAGVRVVETEAYPVGDPAGWAFRGQSRSNAPLFEGFGFIHVYLSYGVSWLISIAAEAGDGGAGVLFRAGEPIWAVRGMIDRRNTRRFVDLTNGPGKLSEALNVGHNYNGGGFFDGGALWIGTSVRPVERLAVSRRIGISKAID